MSGFFPLSFKKYNKLYKYIYTYFFTIPIILLNNFFYNFFDKAKRKIGYPREFEASQLFL